MAVLPASYLYPVSRASGVSGWLFLLHRSHQRSLLPHAFYRRIVLCVFYRFCALSRRERTGFRRVFFILFPRLYSVIFCCYSKPFVDVFKRPEVVYHRISFSTFHFLSAVLSYACYISYNDF